jgi:hypothetical protein
VDKAGKFSAADSALIVRGSPEKDMRVPVSALERSLETRRVVHMDDASNRDELMAFDGA